MDKRLKKDITKILNYLEFGHGEKKNWEEYEKPRPKNHIWYVIRRVRNKIK